MQFERRDIILVAGVVLLLIGLLPFIAPIYAIIVAVAAFFGIKWYSTKRQADILRDVGMGICAECGSIVTKKGCPQCDKHDANLPS